MNATKTLSNGIYAIDGEVYTVIDGRAWITASADIDHAEEIAVEDIPPTAERVDHLMRPEEIEAHHRMARS